jgi:hypothetical protein
MRKIDENLGDPLDSFPGTYKTTRDTWPAFMDTIKVTDVIVTLDIAFGRNRHMDTTVGMYRLGTVTRMFLNLSERGRIPKGSSRITRLRAPRVMFFFDRILLRLLSLEKNNLQD